MKSKTIKKTLHLGKITIAKFSANAVKEAKKSENTKLTCYVCDPFTIDV